MFVYGALTHYGRPFACRSTTPQVSNSLARPADRQAGPTTPHYATPAGYHTHTGLGSIRFRSPLLTESLLFSLPAGTEMFHFPAFPPHTLYIQVRVTRP